MARFSIILMMAVAVAAFGACELLAQDNAPAQGDAQVDAPAEAPAPVLGKNWRGQGHYLSWIKVLACWIAFLMWVYTTDWVSRDCLEVRLNYLRWNPVVFGVFLGAFVLVWWIPWFWLSFPLLVIALIAPLTTYIIYRNSQVMNNERVLTPEHIRFWLSINLGKIGVKIESQRVDPHLKGAPVQLEAVGGEDERADRANTLMARQSEGLLQAREVLHDALSNRASALILDYAQQAVGLRFMIDGVWHEREALERDYADPALEALKILCGLNVQDRQGQQQGTFIAEYQSINYDGTLASQGTKTGERVLLQWVDKKIRFDTLDELGMRDKMQEEVKELINLPQGFVLLSAMPTAGLRTTADVIIHHTDRFTREFMAVEEESNRYEEIENCPVMTYNAAEGQSPAAIFPKVFRFAPDAIICRDLVDGQSVDMLCEESTEDRLVISTIRAKDSAEALLRVLALDANPQQFAETISAVTSQRLIRKLCEACKEAYAPTPQVLTQLGIPEGRVQAFYRPPQQPEEVCEECGGIGYVGRTAVFELLKVGDMVRKVLPTGPKLDALRQAARKDGMRSLQEEGILLVAKGVTSLPELMRVLKSSG